MSPPDNEFSRSTEGSKPTPSERRVGASERTPIERGGLTAAKEPAERPSSKRDPFAPPGKPGNRWIEYGTNAPIPSSYRPKVDKAIDFAYSLIWNKPEFLETFRETVSTMTSVQQPRTAYLDALNKMILNLMEGSTHPMAVKQIKEDSEAKRADPSYRVPFAISVPSGRMTWIREFQLRSGWKGIAGTIIHESAHIAGVALSDPFSEYALRKITEAAGLE